MRRSRLTSLNLRAFWDETALPCGVRGPVESLAFSLFAALRRGEFLSFDILDVLSTTRLQVNLGADGYFEGRFVAWNGDINLWPANWKVTDSPEFADYRT